MPGMYVIHGHTKSIPQSGSSNLQGLSALIDGIPLHDVQIPQQELPDPTTSEINEIEELHLEEDIGIATHIYGTGDLFGLWPSILWGCRFKLV